MLGWPQLHPVLTEAVVRCLAKANSQATENVIPARDEGHTDTVDLRAERPEVAGQRRRIPGLSLCKAGKFQGFPSVCSSAQG